MESDMPIINCPSCGEKTNTALCPGWWDTEERVKAKCTAKLTNKDGKGWKYEKGCGYDAANEFDKKFADDCIHKYPST
jgi:hypothetical protein